MSLPLQGLMATEPPPEPPPRGPEPTTCYICKYRGSRRDLECEFNPNAVSGSISTGPGGGDTITNEYTNGSQDLSISGPGLTWSMVRSYSSSGTGTTSLGNKWQLSATDQYLVQDGSDLVLILNANSQRTFTWDAPSSSYIAPSDSNLVLTHDTTNKAYILTERGHNDRNTYHDFTVTSSVERGKLKEQTTLQLHADGKSGCEYTYDVSGNLIEITTTQGQDYTIEFTYSGSYISKVEVLDGTTLLHEVAYTYYEDVTSPSADIGSTGDLVQVKTSTRVDSDTTTLSDISYVQYRYDADSRIKAVYSNSAIDRIIDANAGITTADDILTKGDSFGTPALGSFANQSVEYYTSNQSTSSIDTIFGTGEDLESTYGGANTDETGMLKKVTAGGCSSCGGSGVSRNLYYLSIDQGTTVDTNEVVKLVVEDVADKDGVAVLRRVYGYNEFGRLLRSAIIDSPTSSPSYWCRSSILSTSGLTHQVTESRGPSAHPVSTAADLRKFLDPYDSETTSWSNDDDTLSTTEGQISLFTYNSNGARTDLKVKKGKNGTAYYVEAADFGDGDGDSTGQDHEEGKLLTATYYYPTKTSTRTDGIKTSYSYTFWDADDTVFKTKTVTLPIISVAQQGSGVATTTKEYYDSLGRLRWEQDGEGYVTYRSYNTVTNKQAYYAQDVDPVSVSTEISSGSTGNWEAWTVGDANTNKPTRDAGLPTPLNRNKRTYFDSYGTVQNTEDYMDDEFHLLNLDKKYITVPIWDSANTKSLSPTTVTVYNDEGQEIESYALRLGFNSFSTSGGVPTGFSTEPSQSDYISWEKNTYDTETGKLLYKDVYHDIPDAGNGTLSTNYYRTVYQYDSLGRNEYEIKVISGSSATDRVEQVTKTIYDVLGRVIETQVGVSGDSSANSHNMTDSYDVYPTLYTVSKTEYDDGGVGEGRVTKSKSYFGTGTNDYTGANYYYTYRGHRRGVEPFYMDGATETPYAPYTMYDLTWDGKTRNTVTYNSAPTWSTLVSSGQGYSHFAYSNTTGRLSFVRNTYNDQGKLYDVRTYKINPSTGLGDHFFGNLTYFDRNGRVVATENSRTNRREFAIDGLGRLYQQRQVLALEGTKYSASGAFQYREPVPNPDLSSMTGGDDRVLTLSHTVYEDFRAVGTHSFSNNHDDISTGSAGIDLSNNDDYTRSTTYQWYDENDNITTTARYGSGDTTAGAGEWKYAAIPTRPVTAPTTSSETVLVTKNNYSSRTGQLESTVDPAGNVMKTIYDDTRRVIYSISNYDDFNELTEAGTGDATDKSKDKVLKYVYPTTSNQTQLIVLDANGDGSLTDNQATTSLYEDAIDPTRVTNVTYPDSSDTSSSGTDQVKMTYNLAGQITQKTNALGTVFDYTFNNKRQPVLTKVTTLGTGVDGHVRSVKRTYNSYNQLQKLTSYANSDGTGTIRNEVEYTYSDVGGVAKMYQSHEGAVNTGTSLFVENQYDDTVGGVVFERNHRQNKLVYPDGRVVFYDYDTGTNNFGFYNQNSFPNKIRETDSAGTELAVYNYRGNGRMATLDLPEPDVKLDYFQGTSSTYAGVDRFGRVTDQYWTGYNSTADVDRFRYAHNYLGQKTSRDIDSSIYATNDKDQSYTYDAGNRLTDFAAGTLVSGSISGTAKQEESWSLDALGNWSNYETKTNGTTDLNQTRTVNAFNEVTDITETTGTAWANPGYDAAGSMTAIPKPSDLTGTYSATYDAWGRMVKLVDGSTTVAEYEYDALNRRILKKRYTSGVLDDILHYYFNVGWQVLEVRKEVSGVEDVDPLEQFVWHPLHVDAPVLRDYDANTDGTSERHYYTFDNNFNVTSVLDNSGTVLERYDYSPYGGISVLDADFSADADGLSDLANEVTFTGRQFDTETGLYHYRNRFYHNQLGQFISRDPIEFSGGTPNLYQYVNSNPVNNLDPMGLADEPGCAVCKTHNNKHATLYSSGSKTLRELDATLTTPEFSTVADWMIDNLNERDDWGQFPKFNKPGLYKFIMPDRNHRVVEVRWLFFVVFNICQDKDGKGGSCQLKLSEGGTKVWYLTPQGNRVLDERNKPKNKFIDITNGKDVRVGKLVSPKKGCDELMIYADLPSAFAREGKVGYLVDLVQRFVVVDPVAKTGFAAGHSKDIVFGVSPDLNVQPGGYTTVNVNNPNQQ